LDPETLEKLAGLVKVLSTRQIVIIIRLFIKRKMVNTI